jgi:hypothetical protein
VNQDILAVHDEFSLIADSLGNGNAWIYDVDGNALILVDRSQVDAAKQVLPLIARAFDAGRELGINVGEEQARRRVREAIGA